MLFLASCSINTGMPNNSSIINTPTKHITMPVAQITTLAPHFATLTAQISTPTATQIRIPAACLKYEDASDWSAKISSSCLTSLSRVIIIETLATVWLSHFTSTNISDETRLNKFTIDSIVIEDLPNLPVSFKPDFTALLTYSVEPTDSHSSWWVAGDGIPGDDGWVRYKRNYVGILKTDDFFEIKIWGYDQA
jgi:hypothetical protein